MTSGKKILRFVVCGDVCVGKSALIQRFHDKIFNLYLGATIGAAFYSSSIKVNKKVQNLQIWYVIRKIN